MPPGLSSDVEEAFTDWLSVFPGVRGLPVPSVTLQTPSDWLIKYSAVRWRAGKGCLCDDGEEEDGDEDEGW